VTLQLITQRYVGQSFQTLRQGSTSQHLGHHAGQPVRDHDLGPARHQRRVECRALGIVGMTQLNGTTQTVSAVTSTTITLGDVNSTGYTAYSCGGTVVPQVVMYAINGNGQVIMQYTNQAASSPFNNADYIGQTVLGHQRQRRPIFRTASASARAIGRSSHDRGR
jgi:hypothetical protein